jgi:hypothetical protein
MDLITGDHVPQDISSSRTDPTDSLSKRKNNRLKNRKKIVDDIMLIYPLLGRKCYRSGFSPGTCLNSY